MFNFKKPRGTEDIYYDKVRELSELETMLKNIVKQYNYCEIRTPIFEYKDLFVKSTSQNINFNTKEMFNVLRKKKDLFVLRPEGTIPVMRSVINNKLYYKYNLPLKLFYIGNMFRYERPQYGRLRQFNQFGVEVIGVNNFLLDIEVIILAFNLLKNIGLNNINLKLNCLSTTENLKNYIDDLKKYLINKKICNNCKQKINCNNILRILDCKIDNKNFNNFPKILEYLNKKERLYFDNIQKYLKYTNINFIIDHKLVRGLNYYTSLVFEISLIDKTNNNELTVIGGGRYDKLASHLQNNFNLPAIGFAVGIERILIFLKKQNIKLINLEILDIYIIFLSKHSYNFIINLLLILRTAGYKVDCNYLECNIKKQFKKIKKLNAKNIIIIGDKEIKNNFVKIKNQKSKIEKCVKIEQILDFLKKENN